MTYHHRARPVETTDSRSETTADKLARRVTGEKRSRSIWRDMQQSWLQGNTNRSARAARSGVKGLMKS